MIEWEYRKIDLNQQHPRSNELELLNAAGAERWELVEITSNNIAYLKRKCREDPAHTSYLGDSVEAESTSEVKAKCRDPATGETWSGRGRMATWLKRKQDAGEDIDGYLI